LCARRARQRRQALDRYRAWLPRREAALFAQLQAQPVNPRAVEDYQATLKGLRGQEVNLETQWQQARAAATAAQVRVTRAEARLQAAARAKEKLVELADKQRQTARRLQEYAEEADLEETALQGYIGRH
jgi:DNA anti-recombination protein RmuC